MQGETTGGDNGCGGDNGGETTGTRGETTGTQHFVDKDVASA